MDGHRILQSACCLQDALAVWILVDRFGLETWHLFNLTSAPLLPATFLSGEPSPPARDAAPPFHKGTSTFKAPPHLDLHEYPPTPDVSLYHLWLCPTWVDHPTRLLDGQATYQIPHHELPISPSCPT